MKYLHSREEVIAMLKELPSSYKAITKAIEMLEATEDKRRDHHFQKVDCCEMLEH